MNRMMRMRAGSLVSAMAQKNSTWRAVPGTVAEKLAAEFALLAGTREKALSLVHALRAGTIQPTGPMGWMDVKISLVLVQESLMRSGAANPSAEQLHLALLHVLGMRASGMGWGRIAFVTAGGNAAGKGIGKGKGGC
jgi:hypothetical protein